MKFRAGPNARREKSPIIPTRSHVNPYDCEEILSYLTASPQACVTPKSTATVEKVYGWTPIESRADKRTSRSLARAKPWGPTLDGMLESDSTSSTDLSTLIPVAPGAPVSEDIQQTMDYNDVEFFMYKSRN